MQDHMVCVVPAGHEWADEEIDVRELRTNKAGNARVGFRVAKRIVNRPSRRPD